MDAVNALTQRVSIPQLTGPEPSEDQIQQLLQAGLRAADHAWMRPTRFILLKGDHRAALSTLFLHSLPDWQNLSQEKQEKSRKLLTRAPLVITVVSKVAEHPKVPRDEQILSSGAVAQNIINAAWALRLGAIWRTGDMAYNPTVRTELGLTDEEHIIGFIYVGHANCTPKNPPELNLNDFVTEWKPKS